jgi:hypothetical protein
MNTKIGGPDSLFDGHPKNLDEATEMYLTKSKNAEGFNEAAAADEESFVCDQHHFSGQSMRNNWFLWWNAGHKYDSWPLNEPPIVAYFRSIGIAHADDMSSIILKSAYRKHNNKPIDLEGQVKYYQDFWKENGFANGIPNQ